MPELHGIGIGRRVAVGPVLRMAAPLAAPTSEPLEGDPADAIAAVDAAVAKVADDLVFRGIRHVLTRNLL